MTDTPDPQEQPLQVDPVAMLQVLQHRAQTDPLLRETLTSAAWETLYRQQTSVVESRDDDDTDSGDGDSENVE